MADRRELCRRRAPVDSSIFISGWTGINTRTTAKKTLVPSAILHLPYLLRLVYASYHITWCLIELATAICNLLRYATDS